MVLAKQHVPIVKKRTCFLKIASQELELCATAGRCSNAALAVRGDSGVQEANLTRSFLQALRPSSATRVIASCALVRAGESQRESTTA